MVSIDRDSPLLRAVLLGAGLVIIAAGMKATSTVANLILLSMLLVPSALAETATATLSASASIVNFGQAVTVSGSVAADPGCLGGRNVTLQWQPADSSGISDVATGTTTADGSFTFVQTQPHSGHYLSLIHI